MLGHINGDRKVNQSRNYDNTVLGGSSVEHEVGQTHNTKLFSQLLNICTGN